MNTRRRIREIAWMGLQGIPRRRMRGGMLARRCRAPLSDRAWMRGPGRRGMDGFARFIAEAE